MYETIEYALHSVSQNRKILLIFNKVFFPDEFSFSRFRLLSKIFIELYQTFFYETLVSWMVVVIYLNDINISLLCIYINISMFRYCVHLIYS